MPESPIQVNQSKYVGDDGKLRYQADGSEVFPGRTGVRRWEVRVSDVDAHRWQAFDTIDERYYGDLYMAPELAQEFVDHLNA